MKLTPLINLRPGTQFRLNEMPSVTGTLIKVTECRALVRLNKAEQEIEEDEGGNIKKSKNITKIISWSSGTMVIPIGYEKLRD